VDIIHHGMIHGIILPMVGTVLGITVHGIIHGTTEVGTVAGMEVGVDTIHHGITVLIIITTTITIQDHTVIQAMPEDREAETIMATEEDIILAPVVTMHAQLHVRDRQDITAALLVRLQDQGIVVEQTVLHAQAQGLAIMDRLTHLPVHLQDLVITTVEQIALLVQVQDQVTTREEVLLRLVQVQDRATVADLHQVIATILQLVRVQGLVITVLVAPAVVHRADQVHDLVTTAAQVVLQAGLVHHQAVARPADLHQGLAIIAVARPVAAGLTHHTTAQAVHPAVLPDHTAAVAAVVVEAGVEAEAVVVADVADKKHKMI